MLSRIQFLVEGFFQSSSRLFHRAGLSPNSLTVIGFLLSGLIAGSLIQPWIGIWALSAALMVSYVRARVGVEGITLKGMGIAERPERLLILILATLFWPVSQAILAGGVLLVAVLSSITVVTRVYRASRILSKAQ